MSAIVLVAALACGQFAPRWGPVSTRFDDGTVRTIQGYVGADGYVHAPETDGTPRPETVATPAIDRPEFETNGVVLGENRDPAGTARAGSPESIAKALQIAEKPIDEIERILPRPPDLVLGVERWIAEAVFWFTIAVLATASFICLIVGLRRLK